MAKEEPDELLDHWFGLASTEGGKLVGPIEVSPRHASEDAAIAEAAKLVEHLKGDKPLARGEGYWVFEVKAVRFVGRSMLSGDDPEE